jgi:hypothetical protein
MRFKILFSLAILLPLISCSYFQRNPDSGYAAPQKASATTSTRRVSDQNSKPKKAPGLSEKTKLQNLENSLDTKKEVEQYSKMLPYFKSEQEQLEFLSQSDFEARQRWLNENHFTSRPAQITTEMKELVDAQDITLGMPQSLVKKSWGEPDVVEVSGNPAFRNERWRYNKYVSTNDGYKPEKKVVYFEGGRVVGWEAE